MDGIGWRYILGVRDWVDIFFEWVGGWVEVYFGWVGVSGGGHSL